MEYNAPKQEPLQPLSYAIEVAAQSIEEPSFQNHGFESMQPDLINSNNSNHPLSSPLNEGATSSQVADPYNQLAAVPQSYVSTSYSNFTPFLPPYNSISQQYIHHMGAVAATTNHLLSKPENPYSPAAGFSESPLNSPMSVTSTSAEHAALGYEYNGRSPGLNGSDSVCSPSDNLPSPFGSNFSYPAETQSPLPPLSPHWKSGLGALEFNSIPYIHSQLHSPGEVHQSSGYSEKRGKRGRPRGSRNKNSQTKQVDSEVFPTDAAFARKKRGRGTRVRGANPGIRARARVVRSPVGGFSHADFEQLTRGPPLYKRGSSTRGRGAMRMCRTCTNCLRTDDCAECVFCKDKSKFGGSNKLKQKCLKKQCVLKGKFIEHDNPTDATSRYIVQKKVPADPPPLSHPPLVAPFQRQPQLSPLLEPHKGSGPSSSAHDYLQEIPFKVWMQVEVSKDLNPSYDYT